MRFIDGAEVEAVLDYPALIAEMAAAHGAGVDQAERLLMTQQRADGPPNHFLIWPAWQNDQALGIKLATTFPTNAGSDMPTVHAVYVLFDGRNGAPSAVIDGTAMTPWKTAADSALGARLLAREDAAHLLMVGAGVMAPHLIRAHLTVRPSIRRVTIWNRTPDRAADLAAALALDGVEIAASENLEGAAGQADLISCATGATAPLIQGAWLKPGTHLDLVGGFTPEMREADDTAVRRARVFVDSRWFTIGHCGDLMAPMASGALAEAEVLGDLAQLCRGEVAGRETEEDITLYKNAGGGHLDLMTARFIASRVA